MSRERRKPDDLAWPEFDPDACCMSVDDGCEFDVQTAARVTRNEARQNIARCTGEPYAEVRVLTRYIRPLTRQEVWERVGMDRWEWEHWDEWAVLADPPDVVPATWRPQDEDPVWGYCDRSDPRGFKVYIDPEAS